MNIITNNITNIPTLLNYAKLRVVCLPLVVALAYSLKLQVLIKRDIYSSSNSSNIEIYFSSTLQ